MGNVPSSKGNSSGDSTVGGGTSTAAVDVATRGDACRLGPWSVDADVDVEVEVEVEVDVDVDVEEVELEVRLGFGFGFGLGMG